MFGHWGCSRKSKGVGEGGTGHIPSGVGVWTVFFFKSVWEEGMYGDWSFPETSERIGQRRRGGGVACGKSLLWGGVRIFS